MDSAQRRGIADGSVEEDDSYELMEPASDMTGVLRKMLDDLPQDELLEFDRILERKLYDIDREEIQEQTDGSDDGFLYCRGFIVAAGKPYYDAVNADPSVAICDIECEEICYLPWHLYHEKHGDLPASDICRETCSNSEGGPERRGPRTQRTQRTEGD